MKASLKAPVAAMGHHLQHFATMACNNLCKVRAKPTHPSTDPCGSSLAVHVWYLRRCYTLTVCCSVTDSVLLATVTQLHWHSAGFLVLALMRHGPYLQHPLAIPWAADGHPLAIPWGRGPFSGDTYPGPMGRHSLAVP